MEQYYKASEIMKILDLSESKFKEWKRLGYVDGSIKEKKGNRIFIYYTKDDLWNIVKFIKLLNWGFHRYAAKILVDSGLEYFEINLKEKNNPWDR